MLRFRVVLLVTIGLAGCSDDASVSSKKFETKWLVPPAALCAADPSRFGNAQRVADVDLGNGCFVHNAYRVQGIAGVAFSQPVTFNCGVANTTAHWLNHVVQPAAEDVFGERVVSMDVPAGFACRPRNNLRGAKLSEHGMGNAIDVSAFTLASGRKVTVKQGWFGSGDDKSFLRDVRSGACGTFKTVLGPGSDSHHDDHLHLDLQQHRRGGAYCR